MFRAVLFDYEDKYKEDFLLLPSLLYSKKEITQNLSEESKIISGDHVLNKYFKLYKILVYDKSERPCARCVVTVYHNSDTAYIGFFECIDDGGCAKLLFEKAEEYAGTEGVKKISGPLDCSFWIKYRLKTDGFGNPPYTGEPYNKEYYKKFFEDNGFGITGKWASNIYPVPPLFLKERNMYENRLENAVKNKYKIVGTRKKDFDETVGIIYGLISETYSDFATYSDITREDFGEIFKDYRYILDYNLLKIAYLGPKPVGFSIVLPDYGNLLFKEMTLLNKFKILLKRIRCNTYVSLYMGVLKEHRGLGKAFTHKIIQNMYLRRSNCIGALIAKGKVTEKYAEKHIIRQNEYVLYEKEL